MRLIIIDIGVQIMIENEGGDGDEEWEYDIAK